MVLGTLCTWGRTRLGPHLIAQRKTNSAQITDLNVRAEARKVLEDNTGEELHDIGFGTEVLIMTPKAHATN